VKTFCDACRPSSVALALLCYYLSEMNAVYAFAVFLTGAGANVFSDVFDVDRDQCNPNKKHRVSVKYPVACGALSMGAMTTSVLIVPADVRIPFMGVNFLMALYSPLAQRCGGLIKNGWVGVTPVLAMEVALQLAGKGYPPVCASVAFVMMMITHESRKDWGDIEGDKEFLVNTMINTHSFPAMMAMGLILHSVLSINLYLSVEGILSQWQGWIHLAIEVGWLLFEFVLYLDWEARQATNINEKESTINPKVLKWMDKLETNINRVWVVFYFLCVHWYVPKTRTAQLHMAILESPYYCGLLAGAFVYFLCFNTLFKKLPKGELKGE